MAKDKVRFTQKDIIEVKTSNRDWENDQTEDICFIWSIENFGFGETVFFYQAYPLKIFGKHLDGK